MTSVYVVSNIVGFNVGGSCSEFPNNWLLIQLTILKNMLNMLDNISFARIVKLTELLLRKPHSLPRKLHLDTRLAILVLIYDYPVVHFYI